MKKTASYEDYQESIKGMESSDYNLALIKKDVLDGRTDKEVFSYSMREFLMQAQASTPTEKCRADMANVCRAFCMRNPDIGYVQVLNREKNS